MRIASASASTRSTVSTTSAASDDAVAPRAASATPAPAAASAGASLMPSPTMIVAAPADSARDRGSFAAGSQSASTASTPTTRPTMSATSARSPVTSTTRRDAGGAQRPHHPGRVRSDRDRRAAAHRPAVAVDGDEHGERPVQVARRRSLPRPLRRLRRRSRPPCRRRTRRPPTVALDAVAGTSCSPAGMVQAQAAARGAAATIEPASTCGDSWSSEAARRSTSSAADPAAATTWSTVGPAAGQRAGLVEQHHRAGRQPFQCGTALDDDAAARGARQPGHDRDGRREQQRARRGDDQHRDRSHRLARSAPRPRPRRRGRAARTPPPPGRRHARTARRTPVPARTSRTRPAIGRLGGRGRQQLAAAPALTTPLRTSSPAARSTGSGSPVSADSSSSAGREQPSVDRAPPRRRRPPAGRRPPPRSTGTSSTRPARDRRADARGALDQQAQVAPGPGVGARLEQLPARQHHRDHRAGEQLAHGERARPVPTPR